MLRNPRSRQFANNPRLITYHRMISRMNYSVWLTTLTSRLSTSGLTSPEVAALDNMAHDHTICSSLCVTYFLTHINLLLNHCVNLSHLYQLTETYL